MSGIERTDEGDVEIKFTCNLSALRLMSRSVDQFYKNWPGGDPAEQEALVELKTNLYTALYSVLMDLDLI